MNKNDLIATIAEQQGLTKTDVAKVIDSLQGVIGKTLKSGDTVAIHGLGTFSARTRAARKGRNPKTGEEIAIAASTSVGFKAFKALNDLV